ncbi:MAG: serine/threonine protein kinase [Nitrospirae bacterium]|nr:serine/threonine protein kinase [Nitrospirota bacterium]
MKAIEWAVGDVLLDLYEIREVYKSGGMGVVYRIYHRGWNVELAMKSPRPEYFQKEEDKRNFEREAETWMDLGLHPNIVSCYYIRRMDDIPRVFAEYLGGGSLRDCVRNHKLTTLETILDIAIQFATGLQYAHEKGLVHQDVKPANVMLSQDGVVKVTDFGLAKARALTDNKARDKDTDLLNRGILVSYGGMTPAYCSPEQANSAPLSTKTDIWSWGVSMLEIFVGRITWMAGNIAYVALDGYLAQGPVDETIPLMPSAFVDLLRRCFQKKPADRPDSMLEIIGELKAMYSDIAGKAYPRTPYLAGRATADGINNRVISLIDLKKAKGVDSLWREALKTDPHHFESTYNLALYEWKNGTITEKDVIRRIKAITNKRHMNWHEYHLLGNLFLFFGNYSGAVEALWKAIRPEYSTAAEIKDLVLALCADGRHLITTASSKDSAAMTRWKDVERHCKSIIDNIPDNIDPYIVSAYMLALTRQGRQRESHEFYGQCRNQYSDKLAHMPSSVTEAFNHYLPGFEVLHTIEEHNGIVASLAVTPDGKRALSAGSDDKSVRVWDIEEGRCLTTLYGHTDWVTCVCVTSDGRFAISGSNDKTLRLWDIGPDTENTTGRCVRVFSGSPDMITAVAVTPDSRYILSGGNDALLRLFSLPGGGQLRIFRGHEGRITSVAITPDGYYAVSGSTDKKAYLFNIVTGKPLRTFTGHTGSVTSVAISPSGTWLLTGSEDTTLRLYNISTGECVHTFRGHTGSVLCVAFSADETLIISGSADETLCLWDISSRQRVCLFKKFEGPAMAITPSGARAVCSIWNGIRILEIANHYALSYAVAIPVSSLEAEEREGSFKREIERARHLIQTNNIRDIPEIIKKARDIKGYEKDREAIEIKEEVAAYFPKKELLGAWQLNAWELYNPEGHTGGVNAVAVTPDNMYALSGAEDGRLYLWELDTTELKAVFDGHEGSVLTLDISPDGRYALSGSSDKTIRLWELPGGRCRHVLRGHTGVINTVAFGTDPRYALSQDYKGLLHFWDLLNKESIRTLHDKEGLTAAALHPDLRYAVTGGSNGAITIWDIALEERYRTIKMLNNSITAVAVSADGRFILATGLYEGAIQLWDFRSGKTIRNFKGHTGGITTACFSADVKHILSVGSDTTVRIWDVETNRELRKFTLPGGKINTAVFSPNAWLCVTGSADRTLSSFYLDWDLDATSYEDWDDRARPYLEIFLTLHTPFVQDTLFRKGIPQYSEEDFHALVRQLSLNGFGWLTPEGIKQKLRQLEKDAVDKWTEADKTYKTLLDLSKSLMQEGLGIKMITALETIKKASSIKGYARDEELLRVYEEISSVFPKKSLVSIWKVRYLKGHEGAINTVAISADGRYAVSGGDDRKVCLWDLAARALLRDFPGHTAEVRAVVFVNNDRFLSGAADRTLRLWDIKSGRCLRVFSEHSEAITSLWADSDGLLAVCGCLDGSIRLWDIDSGDIVGIYKTTAGNVNALAVSPDLKVMLTGGKDRTLTLWHLSTRQPPSVMQGHSDTINAVAIAPNGRFAVSGSEDRSVRSWDLSTAMAMSTYEGHTSGVTAVDISPDGAFVISAGRDNNLCLWRLSGNNEDSTLRGANDEARTFNGHDDVVLAAAFTPNASHVLSAGADKTICMWHLQWQEELVETDEGQQQCQVYIEDFLLRHRPLMKDSLARKGKPLWGKDDLNALLEQLRYRGLGLIPPQWVQQRLIQLSDEQAHKAREVEALFVELIEVARASLKERSYARALEFVSRAIRAEGYERDPRALAVMEQLSLIYPRNKLNTSWKHKTLQVKGANMSLFIFMPPDVTWSAQERPGAIKNQERPAATKTGKEYVRYAIRVASDRALSLWDLETWRSVVVFRGHQGEVTSADITADGRLAVSGSKDTTLRLWDVATGQCRGVFEGHTGGVNTVAITPDGKYVLSGSDDATLRLWDATTMARLKVFKNNASVVKSLKISPDGIYLFCGNSDGTINFMDISLGRVIHTFSGHEGEITSLIVSPNGRHVISCGVDAVIRMWDIPTGECLRLFTGHAGAVTTAAITPNGRYLISGSTDKTVRIWDVQSAELIQGIKWHAGEVRCVAISGDGTFMFSGGLDPFAYLWYLDWNLQGRPITQWDDGARAYLEAFLCMRTLRLGGLSMFSRKPQWSDDEFNTLLKKLAYAGYGWLSPQGVRQKLDEMTNKYKAILAEKKKLFEKQFRPDSPYKIF